MATPHATIQEAIDATARSGVKRATEQDRSLEYMSIDDMVKADEHVQGNAAGAKPHFGLRMSRCVPPGAG